MAVAAELAPGSRKQQAVRPFAGEAIEHLPSRSEIAKTFPVASRFRVFSSYSLALIGEINVLQRLQNDMLKQPRTTEPYLNAVQKVETERKSAIATLIAQVEKRD